MGHPQAWQGLGAEVMLFAFVASSWDALYRHPVKGHLNPSSQTVLNTEDTLPTGDPCWLTTRAGHPRTSLDGHWGLSRPSLLVLLHPRQGAQGPHLSLPLVGLQQRLSADTVSQRGG